MFYTSALSRVVIKRSVYIDEYAYIHIIRQTQTNCIRLGSEQYLYSHIFYLHVYLLLRILAELVCMPLSLHSLDVINRLAQLPITSLSTTSNIPLPDNIIASRPVISINVSNVSAINGNNNTNGHTSYVVIESLLLSNSFLGRYVAHCVKVDLFTY